MLAEKQRDNVTVSQARTQIWREGSHWQWKSFQCTSLALVLCLISPIIHHRNARPHLMLQSLGSVLFFKMAAKKKVPHCFKKRVIKMFFLKINLFLWYGSLYMYFIAIHHLLNWMQCFYFGNKSKTKNLHLHKKTTTYFSRVSSRVELFKFWMALSTRSLRIRSCLKKYWNFMRFESLVVLLKKVAVKV